MLLGKKREAFFQKSFSSFKFEIVVSFVKCVNLNVTVLTTTSITLAIRMKLNTINRSEMSFHSCKFLIVVNHVIKFSIKFANFRGCRRDIHSLLTTTKDDVSIDGRDCCAVHWSIGFISFHTL